MTCGRRGRDAHRRVGSHALRREHPNRRLGEVLGAVAEFEKTTLVAKLAAERRGKRMATGEKVEGRKSHAELRPDVAKLAKALARKRPKGGRLSLRAISEALTEQGYLNERGKPFNPKSVAVMLGARH